MNRIIISFQFKHKHMKFALSAFAFAFAFIPAQAFSGQILPSLYAAKFCELRTIGVSVEDSIKAATDYSYVSGTDSLKLKWNNQLVNADILNAVLQTNKLCPHYMR